MREREREKERCKDRSFKPWLCEELEIATLRLEMQYEWSAETLMKMKKKMKKKMNALQILE